MKNEKDEKSSDVITTRDTLSNESESNHTCYSIILFSKFELCIMQCKMSFFSSGPG